MLKPFGGIGGDPLMYVQETNCSRSQKHLNHIRLHYKHLHYEHLEANS